MFKYFPEIVKKVLLGLAMEGFIVIVIAGIA